MVEKRDVIVSFALKTSEKEKLVEAANKEGVRMSDYIRKPVLKQAINDLKGK